MATEKKPNGLIKEKSPYLLQHAYNPVYWYPWSDEVFEKAKMEDKPIFLSIGYSTCHWCHVMEKESYDDQEVANVLNRIFVSIKVDREERPDIDSAYMEVCQKISGNCGWPLNVLMTSDKKPFYVFTYMPKSDLIQVAEKTEELWKNERKALENDAEKVVKTLAEGEKGISLGLDAGLLSSSFGQFSDLYDNINGGFGTAPKFPAAQNLSYLLRYWKRNNDSSALEMVENTLSKMRMGGIFDQVGFGFHRYSTDPYWLVPHFEKMLYDQAILAIAYAEAYQATGNEKYKKTMMEILEFVKREMVSKELAFCSAIDADSEGVEGKFYLWDYYEIEKLLGKERTELAVKMFNIKKEGNFTERGKPIGKNILHMENDMGQEFWAEANAIRKILFEYREKRVHPQLDDKILVDLNGLMIAAFAKAAQVTGEKEYAETAALAVKFIEKKMHYGKNRLYHRFRDGQAAVGAFLDDYAFYIHGLIELYEATFDTQYLQMAVAYADVLQNHFWDENGGFFFEADDSEQLFARRMDAYDGAMPSGNSIMMLNLLRLSHLTGNLELQDRAIKIGSVFSRLIARSPLGFGQMLIAIDFLLGPSYEVVLVEGSDKDMMNKMLQKLNRSFIPNKIIIVKTEKTTPMISKIADYTKFLTAHNGKTTACVCASYACKLPTNDPDQMLKLLKEKE